jgi:hypothetical protein
MGSAGQGMRYVGRLVLALLACAQALPLLHVWWEPHALCPIDGELVHAGSVGEALESHARAAQADARESRFTESSSEQGHAEHCPVAVLAERRELPLVTCVLRPAAASEGRFVGLRSAEPCEQPFPLYLLAPKASPPLRS